MKHTKKSFSSIFTIIYSLLSSNIKKIWIQIHTKNITTEIEHDGEYISLKPQQEIIPISISYTPKKPPKEIIIPQIQ